MASEQPAPVAPEVDMDANGAVDAAEQMLAATEKLRATLPMMQGEAPAQPTGD